MKNSVLKISCGLILAALLTGCSWQVPQKLSVRTKAEYNFTAASIEKDLSQFVSAETLQNLVNSAAPDKDIVIYDYNPGKTALDQQYLFRVLVHKIPLNIPEYMNNLLVDELKVDQTFKLPEVSVKENRNLTPESVSSNLNGMVIFGGLVMPGDTNITGVGDAGEKFDYFEYAYGSMKIYIDGTAGANPYVTLKHNGNTVAVGNFTPCLTPVTKGLDDDPLISFDATYEAELDLAGASVYMNGMTVEFSDCGNAKMFYGEVSEESKITRASGVTLSNYKIELDDQVVSGILPAGIKDCKVGEGSLKMDLKLPSTWTGTNLDFSIETTGAMTLPKSNGTVDLKNVSIGSGDLTIKPEVNLSITNGELDLTSDIAFELECNVSKVASVTVDTALLSSGMETSLDESVLIPDTLKTYVKTIYFDDSVLHVKSTNTMPEGNDITVECTSNFLGYDHAPVNLKANAKEYETKLTATPDDLEGPGTSVAAGVVDFNAEIILPGASGTEATFKNLEPGKEYSLGIEIIPEIKFSEVVIDLTKVSTKIDGNMDTGFSLNKILETVSTPNSTLLKCMEFKSIPVYFYCQKPDLPVFDSLVMKGKAWLNGGDGFEKYIFGSKSGTDNLTFVKVPELEIEEDTVVSNLSLIRQSLPLISDVAKVFSPRNTETIKLNFDIEASGTSGDVRLTKEDLEGQCDVEIVAYMALPLYFNIDSSVLGAEKQAELNLSDIIGKSGKDIFNRKEAWNIKDFEAYLDAVKSAKLSVTSDTLPFSYMQKDKSVQVAVNLNTEGSEAKYLKLESGEYELLGSEIKDVLKTYPFTPDMKIVFPDGDLLVTRGMNLKTKIDFQLKTDGDIVLFDNRETK